MWWGGVGWSGVEWTGLEWIGVERSGICSRTRVWSRFQELRNRQRYRYYLKEVFEAVVLLVGRDISTLIKYALGCMVWSGLVCSGW